MVVMFLRLVLGGEVREARTTERERPEMTEHVSLDVRQLQHDALPVPHMLGDHLTDSHHTLIHIQTGGSGGLGT